MASRKGPNKPTRARPAAPATVEAVAERPPAGRPMKPAAGRTSYRCPLSVPMRLRFRVEGRERVEVTATENLSHGGAYFISAEPYRKDMPLRVAIPYDGRSAEAAEAEARVKRIVPGPDGRTGIGIRFADPMKVNALLGEVLQKHVRISDLLLRVMKAVGSELELDALLIKLVARTSEAMDAERTTLFLLDRKTRELWSRVAEGERVGEIRLPMGKGIAGHVAASGEIVNITDAYADPRFDRSFDARTGFRTRTILCMPIHNDHGEIVGVTQVLNKRAGAFARDDEDLLDALNAQMAVCLHNAALFEEVRNMRNYNQAILNSIATGVVTLDEDGRVATLSPAAAAIFGLTPAETLGRHYTEVLGGLSSRILDLVIEGYVDRSAHKAYDLACTRPDGDSVSVNLSVLPLLDPAEQSLGMVIVAHDITQEQRLMGTLCRYVTREIAEQILADRDSLKLGGARSKVAVLFSDIRNFTAMSERAADPEEIVSFLNSYFERMIRVIFDHEGMLDKFIGDAIMAVFGAPVSRGDDALRAVRTARDMRRELRRFNEARRAEGLPEVEIGIGICNGEAICGNIGSEQRMEYTVIGDTVNLASRLEGLTKDKPYKILINESAYEEVKHEIPCVSLGLARIKGKEKPLLVYGVPDPE